MGRKPEWLLLASPKAWTMWRLSGICILGFYSSTMLGPLTTGMHYLVLQCGKTGPMLPPARSCSVEAASRIFSTQHSFSLGNKFC